MSSPGPPTDEPIGLELARTAKAVSRAFDDALDDAGGSLPTWVVLVSVKRVQRGTQREIARHVGIEGPTLTHHLDRMEAEGLVTRSRDPRDRRTHRVELTDAGEATFRDLLGVVVEFDRRLREGLAERELADLRRLLARLRANAGARDDVGTAAP